MLLTQGRHWRVELSKKRDAVTLGLGALPEELHELRELRLEVPLTRWQSVVRHAGSDRKLLGGILLDCASPKDLVARAVASDRLLAELQRMVRDATVALVEVEALVLAPTATEED